MKVLYEILITLLTIKLVKSAVLTDEGLTVLLVCPIKADSGQIISWSGPPDGSFPYAQGTQINPKLQQSLKNRLLVTGENSNGEYNLQIKDIQQSDGGVYECSGISGGENPKEKFTLIIKAPPSSGPTIRSNSTGSIITRGTVIVTCEVTGGRPLANISWECDGASNVQDTQVDNKTISSVKLTVYKPDNGKVCRCKAIHPSWIQPRTTDLVLNVLYPPDTAPSVQQSPPGPVITGDTVTLTCNISGGNPLATLSWDCIGKATTITSGNTTSNSIELVVDNSYNNRICNCSTTHPLSSYTVPHKFVVYFAPEKPPSIQPNPPGPVFSGNNIKLICSVSGGNPLATLSWDCNGTTTNTTIGNIASYVVEFTVSKNDDLRICTCSAKHPDVSYRPTAQYQLTVYYSPERAPSIKQIPPGPIIDGDTVTLTCTVSGGNPLATLSWNCTGTRTNATSGNTASYSLELTVNKTYNNRICTCSASHPVTSYNLTDRHLLTVYYSPDGKLQIQQTPLNGIITGNNVTLKCTLLGGNPLAWLSWDCIGITTNDTFGNMASYSVTLTVDKTYNNKICTCSASHPVTSYKPTLPHELVVYYSPDKPLSIQQTPPGPIITGDKVTLTCNVSGGNPLATLSWDCNGTTTNTISGDTTSYSLELQVDKTYNDINCTCSGKHVDASYRATVQQRLVVYFPPDVVIIKNENVDILEGTEITLICNASGNPPNYTFHAWRHTIGNTTVRSLNNTFFPGKLKITRLSYSDIGNYTCLVDNKIKDRQNNIIQSASTLVIIKIRPVFLDYKRTVSSKIGGNVTATLKVFSFPDIFKPVIWKNASDNSILHNGTNLYLSLTEKPIMTKCYGVDVFLDTFSYETDFHLIDFQVKHQGFYTLLVNNSYSTNNVTLNIVISDKPESPKGFSVKSISSNMVILSWTAGFNGGNIQTFTITYSKINTVELISERKLEQSDSDEYNITISGLSPSTTYIFTITSSNSEGIALSENNSLVIETKSSLEHSEQSLTGPVVGSLSGILVAAILVIIIIFYIRRRKGTEAGKKEQLSKLAYDSGHNNDELHDNILYESAGPNFKGKTDECTVEYAVVNKDMTTVLSNAKAVSEVKKIPTGKMTAHGVSTRTRSRNDNKQEDVYENTSVNRNKDGLQYADLLFNPSPNGAKFIIHGLDDRVIYAEVDTTQNIDPLPSDDEDVDTKT